MERAICYVQRSYWLLRNIANSIIVVFILVLLLTSSCLSKSSPKKDTIQPKAWNLKESDYSNCYKYGVLLVDSLVNNKNWKIEWLPNSYIKFQIDNNVDSVEFDIIHKRAFEYGFFNIITKKNGHIKSKIIHYLNKNTAILTVPDGLGRPYFFCLKKLAKKVTIQQLDVDLNELPALIINDVLIRSEESYAKNDSTEIRNIFAYKLNLGEGENNILITKKYEVLENNGGVYFSSYTNENLFNFIASYFCQNKDAVFELCNY
ncbi:hypothetical protein AB832_06835 [Flavobacteriaceae bacterium (ex Bugula neritina AB1)]|nr:hypothetical protein AB832_06835 [Flavobacteriaceae bacterium (ex Bugula neritina AB1)]